MKDSFYFKMTVDEWEDMENNGMFNYFSSSDISFHSKKSFFS